MIDLLDARDLFHARGRDLAHDVVHAAHALHDLVHGLAGLMDELGAFFDFTDRCIDQALDLAGCGGRALRKRAHFGRDDREAAPLRARARGFDRGIECEDVGLEGDAVDDADDVRDPGRRSIDGVHRGDDLRHHLGTLGRDMRSGLGQLIRLARAVGVLARRVGQLRHRIGGFAQRGRLRLGTRRQILVARGDALGGRGDGRGALAHTRDDLDQARTHVAQSLLQTADLVARIDFDALGQIAFGDAARDRDAAFERTRDDLADERIDDHQHRDAGDDGGQNALQALLGEGRVRLVERHLHADHAEHRAFGHLVAGDAILAQIIMACERRTHRAQVFALVVAFDADHFLTRLQDLLFDGVDIGLVVVGARPEDALDAIATDHADVADRAELFDLVEEDAALRDRAGDHHAGQAGHGGFVHALREALRLIDGRAPVDLILPKNHASPDHGEREPDRRQQLNPDTRIGDAHGLSLHKNCCAGGADRSRHAPPSRSSQAA